MINAINGTPANSLNQASMPMANNSFDSVVAQIRNGSGMNSTSATPSSTPIPPNNPYGAAIPLAGGKGTGSGGSLGKRKNKSMMKSVIAGVVLLLLVAGGVVAYIMTSKSTELRQQAAGEQNKATCGSACSADTDCTSGNVCYQPPMPVCPDGVSCSQVMPAKRCAARACAANPTTCDSALCNVNKCSLSFTVPGNGANSISCDKIAYRDELSNSAGSYTLAQRQSTFLAGDVVVFNLDLHNTGTQTLSIGATDLLTANNLQNTTFKDSNCGSNAFNTTTRTLTCPAVSIAPGASVSRTFRLKLNAGIAAGTVLANTATATVDSPQLQTTCSASVTVATTVLPTPTPTPTFYCNSNCSSNSDCQSVNSNYICASEYDNVCRLSSNRSSNVCAVANTTYSCNSSCSSNAQCQQANSNYICSNYLCRLDSNPNSSTCQYPATTVVGCNQSCSTNADCASADQICVSTDQGLVCRLAANPSSGTCSLPGSNTVVTNGTTNTTTYVSNGGTNQTTQTVVVSTPQPTQPSQLPVTGVGDDVLKFLGVGAGVLILGAAGLLVL